jgi:hypothetical protein
MSALCLQEGIGIYPYKYCMFFCRRREIAVHNAIQTGIIIPIVTGRYLIRRTIPDAKV